MKKSARFLALSTIALAVLGCQSRTDRVDSPVILTIQGTTTIVTPASVSVSAALTTGEATIQSMTLSLVLKDPNATSTALEAVEMDSYSVTYRRADRGTSVPPPMTEALFGEITVGGTMTLNNFPFLRSAQLTQPPLSELAANGVDPDTGSQTILLNVDLQFFAHTLSGKAVASSPQTFTVEMLP